MSSILKIPKEHIAFLRPILEDETLTVLLIVLALTIVVWKTFNFILMILKGVSTYFLRPSIDPKSFGAWAVVTGATDGIGKEYAKQLAAKGMNIVLISRTQSRLDEVAKEIKEKSKVQVQTIAIDFSSFDQNKSAELRRTLSSLEVGVLVNNVGVSYNYPEYLADVSEADIWSLIHVNIVPTTILSHIVLPGMISRKNGAIINVASASALQPMALLTVYSAAKAYVDFFSRALAAEYESKGIFVQSVLPFMVVSKLSKVRHPSLFTPSAAKFVRSSLSTIGHDSRTVGYWSHALQSWALDQLPPFLVDKIVFDQHKAIRNKALRKKKIEKSE